MTIADEPPESKNEKDSAGKKLEKSLDAVAALRQAMERRLAAAKESPAPVEEIERAPEEETQAQAPQTTAAPPPEPTPRPKAEQPRPKKEPDANKAEPVPPINTDPIEWSRILTRVGEQNQKLLQTYFSHMQGKQADSIPFTPTPFIESFSNLSSALVQDPEAFTKAQLAIWQNYVDLTRATIQRLQGGAEFKPVIEPAKGDKRFNGVDWQTNWLFDYLKQAYLSAADETRKLVHQEAEKMDAKQARKIEFYTRMFLEAAAPNNFWATNPEVLRETMETKGENLVKGFKNLLDDMERGNGTLRLKMTDLSAFEVGKNIATTPGKVVYQNDLIQLIQYEPSTPTVKKVPFLVTPPWINKFYILDLREKNSFIGYLVSQGHTVYCISWVNPVKRHALTQFEDYMDKGILDALREIKRITGEEEANVLGYCIGGTTLACALAYLKALPEYPDDLPRINSATYLVSMIDFADPGELGVFIDEAQISMLEDRMARQGYMDAGSMMTTFNLLRANDLIWPFVINNYLMGRDPFPFDLLYWNTDSTNLPAAMQSYYLRKMYLENKLIEPNALKMRGVPIDLTTITTPSFLLATKEDHIAPWRSAYAPTQIYKGDVTFVLSGSGHIAGVVNPPVAEKYCYWTNDIAHPPKPEDWLATATEHKGSWWPEWIKWLDQYAGEDIKPRAIGDSIEDAPGSYVKVRVV